MTHEEAKIKAIEYRDAVLDFEFAAQRVANNRKLLKMRDGIARLEQDIYCAGYSVESLLKEATCE